MKPATRSHGVPSRTRDASSRQRSAQGRHQNGGKTGDQAQDRDQETRGKGDKGFGHNRSSARS